MLHNDDDIMTYKPLTEFKSIKIFSKVTYVQDFESNQDPVRHKSSCKRMREKLLRKLPEKHHSMQCPKICDEMIYTDRLKMIEMKPIEPQLLRFYFDVTKLMFYFDDDVIEEIEEKGRYPSVRYGYGALAKICAFRR
uniref:Uncharacterized protein n=1 Tax=Strigamia maritima TaxID=126957 RepID=T1JJ00_STRMM